MLNKTPVVGILIVLSLLLGGCASTPVAPEAPAVEVEPEVDPRAQFWVDAVAENWETCWPLLGDDTPVYSFREDEDGLRVGYVDVEFVAETLTFIVGKGNGGANLTFPDELTALRVEGAGCYEIE